MLKLKIVYEDDSEELIKINSVAFYPEKNVISYMPVGYDDFIDIDLKEEAIKAIAVFND